MDTLKLKKMKKQPIDYFEKLCSRMPEGVMLENDSGYELTDNEYIAACSWVGIFKNHYENIGQKPMEFIFIPISKRMHMDFGLFYMQPLNEPVVTINKTKPGTVKYNEKTWLRRWLP